MWFNRFRNCSDNHVLLFYGLSLQWRDCCSAGRFSDSWGSSPACPFDKRNMEKTFPQHGSCQDKWTECNPKGTDKFTAAKKDEAGSNCKALETKDGQLNHGSHDCKLEADGKTCVKDKNGKCKG